MSIRIGLYDFFAYTLPGVFYLLIALSGLALFKYVLLDWTTFNSLSVYVAFLIIGAGYVVGLLMDAIAYRWLCLFYKRNSETRRSALEIIQRRYLWLQFDIQISEWPVLLHRIKSKSLEAAADIEQHNVASIMLRNVSLGLVIASIELLVYFLFTNRQGWVIILILGLTLLAILALRRSQTRRLWFYLGVFEAFVAHSLPIDEWFSQRIQKRSDILSKSQEPLTPSES